MQATEIVTKAVQLDEAGEYEKALPQYKLALEYFLTALKYETNKAVKDQIMIRVNGYMKRAEELKGALSGATKPVGGTGASGRFTFQVLNTYF